jgi:hypothetical protein
MPQQKWPCGARSEPLTLPLSSGPGARRRLAGYCNGTPRKGRTSTSRKVNGALRCFGSGRSPHAPKKTAVISVGSWTARLGSSPRTVPNDRPRSGPSPPGRAGCRQTRSLSSERGSAGIGASLCRHRSSARNPYRERDPPVKETSTSAWRILR